jgi:membrane protein
VLTFATQELLAGDRLVESAVNFIHVGLSFLMLFAAFSALIKVLPDTPVTWREAAVGAVAGALLFSVGKHVFALYLAHAGTKDVFGAASSLTVVMMWLYFSAGVFLLGAEVAAHWRGRQPQEQREAESRNAGESSRIGPIANAPH